jgi:hypothetical protein
MRASVASVRYEIDRRTSQFTVPALAQLQSDYGIRLAAIAGTLRSFRTSGISRFT